MNPLRTVQTALRFRTVTHAAFPLRLFPASFRGYITAAVDTPRPGSIPEEYASAPKGYSRTRREWTKEESDLLMRLASNRQMSWRTIASHFQNRSPSSCHTRYRLLISKREDDYQGPWTPEEMHKLRELTEGKTTADEIDWEEVQIALPRRRRLVYIKLAWEHSVNPKLKFGRWSDDEIERLRKMVQLYGINNWDAVAEGVGTRTKRQCLERWRWQQAADIHKGRFTPEEDEMILKGVEKFGEDFAQIKTFMNTNRTARALSQRYRYALSPNTDRSPWTEEEVALVYETCNSLEGDMTETKKKLNSKRSIKDMWNHYYLYHRRLHRAKDEESIESDKEDNNINNLE